MNQIDTFKTVNVLTLAFLIGYLVFSINWLLWVAFLLAIGNAFESRITSWIAEYWMKLAVIVGNFNSKIILSVIFFIVLTPIALVYRFFNQELVNHFRKNQRQSYFDDVNKSFTKSDFEKLW
ncbi:MAG: SxtJ family membrane protein [Deltaproteobacteria bacterium]